MTKQVQRRRGTATQHTSFTGAEGEISVNTTNKSIHVHDGSTAGGIEGARADLTNVSDSDLNARLTGNTLSSLTITSADINGGTIDGTVIGGTTPAAGNFTTGSFTGDVSFGDNDKAIFGAGSDLQIYHDGSHSRIVESGTGQLKIQGTELQIYNADATKLQFQALDSGEVSVYYNNSKKLATTSTGIDVTGTVTADGLTVDGSIVLDNASAQNISFTNASVNPTISSVRALNIDIDSDGNQGTTAINFTHDSGAGTIASFNETGDISFYEDTGTTPKFFWDASAEYLSVGGTTGTFAPINLIGSNGRLGLNNGNTSGGVKIQSFAATNANGYLAFEGWDKEYMRIDSSGNVGIGVAPENSSGTWRNFEQGGMNMAARSSGAVDGMVGTNYVFKTDNSEVYKTTGAASRLFFNDSAMQFQIAASGTAGNAISWDEAMRLDASGNLLVGTTDAAVGVGNTNTGLSLANSGYAAFSRTGSPTQSTLFLNKNSNDGSIVNFAKNGTTVGSIGAFNGDTVMGTGLSAVRFNDGVPAITPHRMDTNATHDASADLGQATVRWRDLYLSGGVYLGGTGAANKLDDYEEGTWTPHTFTDWSVNPTFSSTPTYTKIGRTVTLFIHILTGTTGNQAKFSGVPFAGNGTGAGVSGGIADMGHAFVSSTNCWFTLDNTSLAGTRFTVTYVV